MSQDRHEEGNAMGMKAVDVGAADPQMDALANFMIDRLRERPEHLARHTGPDDEVVGMVILPLVRRRSADGDMWSSGFLVAVADDCEDQVPDAAITEALRGGGQDWYRTVNAKRVATLMAYCDGLLDVPGVETMLKEDWDTIRGYLGLKTLPQHKPVLRALLVKLKDVLAQ